MISVIIPARNELHLRRTVEDVIRKAAGEIEIIVVLDQWDFNKAVKPEPLLEQLDWIRGPGQEISNVRLIEYPNLTGQRVMINRAIREATGSHILKIDAHCKLSDGYDVALLEVCEPDTFYTTAMRGITEETWTSNDRVFAAALLTPEYRWAWWPGYDNHVGHLPTHEIMAFSGTVYFCSKELWEGIGGHDATFAPWGECGAELSLKVWLTGRRLMIHRGVCCAHLYRKKFPYRVTGGTRNATIRAITKMVQEKAFADQVHDIPWLVGKFSRFGQIPGWPKGSMQCTNQAG